MVSSSEVERARRELEADKRELASLKPTPEQMELLVRNVSRDAKLSPEELLELRVLRDRIGLRRWETWLDLAREQKRNAQVEPQVEKKVPLDGQIQTLLRRLDAARGAALLASAVSADARDLNDVNALRQAEDHLRAFAASCVDLTDALNIFVSADSTSPSRQAEPPSSEVSAPFKATFADHLRRRAATPRNDDDGPAPYSPGPSISLRRSFFHDHQSAAGLNNNNLPTKRPTRVFR